MTVHHREQAAGRWKTLSLLQHLANVGSEVERTIAWKHRGRAEIAMRAFEQALELLDLTIADDRHRGRRRELTRVREGLMDHFCCSNDYGSSESDCQRYFLQFAVAARSGR
jgi:hypothetical protein